MVATHPLIIMFRSTRSSVLLIPPLHIIISYIQILRYFLFTDHIIICVSLVSYRRIPRQQSFMQDQIIASHTRFGGHIDVNC